MTAAASFALYLMLSDRLLVRTEALATGAWTALGAAASLITFSSLRGQFRVPFHRWDQLAVYGLATGAAFALMFAALRRVGSQRTSVLLTLEAVSAIALAAVFLGESIGAVEAGGGAAVLVAAVVISLTPTRPPIGAASEPP